MLVYFNQLFILLFYFVYLLKYSYIIVVMKILPVSLHLQMAPMAFFVVIQAPHNFPLFPYYPVGVEFQVLSSLDFRPSSSFANWNCRWWKLIENLQEKIGSLQWCTLKYTECLGKATFDDVHSVNNKELINIRPRVKKIDIMYLGITVCQPREQDKSIYVTKNQYYALAKVIFILHLHLSSCFWFQLPYHSIYFLIKIRY